MEQRALLEPWEAGAIAAVDTSPEIPFYWQNSKKSDNADCVCVKQRPPVCLNCRPCVTQQGYLLIYAQDKACMCLSENKPQMLSAMLPSGKEGGKSLWLGQVTIHLIKARQCKGGRATLTLDVRSWVSLRRPKERQNCHGSWMCGKTLNSLRCRSQERDWDWR